MDQPQRIDIHKQTSDVIYKKVQAKFIFTHNDSWLVLCLRHLPKQRQPMQNADNPNPKTTIVSNWEYGIKVGWTTKEETREILSAKKEPQYIHYTKRKKKTKRFIVYVFKKNKIF